MQLVEVPMLRSTVERLDAAAAREQEVTGGEYSRQKVIRELVNAQLDLDTKRRWADRNAGESSRYPKRER